jgi:hypothetical protein
VTDKTQFFYRTRTRTDRRNTTNRLIPIGPWTSAEVFTDWRYFGAIPNRSRYDRRAAQPGAAYATYFLVRAFFAAPRERAPDFV